MLPILTAQALSKKKAPKSNQAYNWSKIHKIMDVEGKDTIKNLLQTHNPIGVVRVRVFVGLLTHPMGPEFQSEKGQKRA